MSASRPVRILYAALGLVCVALGAIGVFVPGLPTTVFLIVASYLFIRSCPVLEERLIRNRLFRPYLRYVDGEPMPRRVQIRVLILMWAAVTLSLVTLYMGDNLRLWVGALIVLAAACGTLVILRRGSSHSPARTSFVALPTEPSQPDQSAG